MASRSTSSSDGILLSSGSFSGLYKGMPSWSVDQLGWYIHHEDGDLSDVPGIDSTNWTQTVVSVAGNGSLGVSNNTAPIIGGQGEVRAFWPGTLPNQDVLKQLDSGMGVDGPVFYQGYNGTENLSPTEMVFSYLTFSETGAGSTGFIGMCRHVSLGSILPTAESDGINFNVPHIGFSWNSDDNWKFSASNGTDIVTYDTDFNIVNPFGPPGSAEDNKVNMFGFRVVGDSIFHVYARYLDEGGLKFKQPWTLVSSLQLENGISDKLFPTMGVIVNAVVTNFGTDYINFAIKRDRSFLWS